MSTFHSETEQSLGLFVCFCKTPIYFYRVLETAFQCGNVLSVCFIPYRKGQGIMALPGHGPCCPW